MVWKLWGNIFCTIDAKSFVLSWEFINVHAMVSWQWSHSSTQKLVLDEDARVGLPSNQVPQVLLIVVMPSCRDELELFWGGNAITPISIIPTSKSQRVSQGKHCQQPHPLSSQIVTNASYQWWISFLTSVASISVLWIYFRGDSDILLREIEVSLSAVLRLGSLLI